MASEDMDYPDESVKIFFRKADQYGFLSIIEPPVERNWKYPYESRIKGLPCDSTWPYFDFTH